MSIKHLEEYRTPELSRPLVDRIHHVSHTPIRIMEVCGTHTVSIFRSGIRGILPKTITLLSGPGCPVCVTAQQEIDAFVALADMPDIIVATFGDLIRVPGTSGSLREQKAAGKDIRVVYSTLDALDIARNHPDKTIVFPGIGFETTAPTVAAAILTAKDMGLTNFLVYSACKTVPPALDALVMDKTNRIDGFLLPGHVSVILGLKAYRPLIESAHIPCVVAGFEPADILQAIAMLVEQVETGQACLENAYPRAVTEDGNPKARQMMADVFDTGDARWRGIGVLHQSGLRLKPAFAQFDAEAVLKPEVSHSEEPKGCGCGDVLKGLKIPPECKLYKTVCTPANPVGPCMVSSEGTCAAWYRYHG
ncbi:MAG: hydrogenase formation protein HypD [Desulfatirhabdiaceae bacterium]